MKKLLIIYLLSFAVIELLVYTLNSAGVSGNRDSVEDIERYFHEKTLNTDENIILKSIVNEEITFLFPGVYIIRPGVAKYMINPERKKSELESEFDNCVRSYTKYADTVSFINFSVASYHPFDTQTIIQSPTLDTLEDERVKDRQYIKAYVDRMSYLGLSKEAIISHELLHMRFHDYTYWPEWIISLAAMVLPILAVIRRSFPGEKYKYVIYFLIAPMGFWASEMLVFILTSGYIRTYGDFSHWLKNMLFAVLILIAYISFSRKVIGHSEKNEYEKA